PELQEIVKSKGIYAKLIKYAKTLEGLARHASTHAAGVVIAPTPLTDYLPLYKHSNGKSKYDKNTHQITSGEFTTQFTMKYVEEIGLLKMDFLGLRTLTVINNVVEEINKEGNQLNLDNIPIDDKETYELFSRGETISIFQFESPGMREYIKKLKPECLDDLTAMNALYRPGPMDMIDDFIQRKHGIKKIKYLHPILEPILKETYGIIVYQEQVIRIASDLGGFSMGAGDQFRRAMGKKNVEVMMAQREKFIKGTTKKKINKKIANEIFELMYKFAGYGFNKSHAAGYALIAYQTAYLKIHHPAIFMAATISSEMDRIDRVVKLIDECKKMGIEITPPDINGSYYNFKVIDNKIRFGLGAIKNVGKNAIESIINSRNNEGRFNSIFDLCKKVDLRLVNRKVLESLVQVGALDSTEGTRAQKFNSIEQAIIFGQKFQEEKEKKQTNIFELTSSDNKSNTQEPHLSKAHKEWTKLQDLVKEKELLGFYISGHPLLKYETVINAFSNTNINNINNLTDKTSVRLAGIITQVKKILDKNNKTMAFITIEDLTGSAEIILFSDTFNKYSNILNNDSMVFITGNISTKNQNNVKIICQEVTPIEEAADKYTKYIMLRFKTDNINKTILKNIEDEIKKYDGKCNIYFEVNTKNGEKLTLQSQKYKVSLNNKLISNLKKILGNENVIMHC
ncbi:DNA polymerase III subunit alpha, partial [candidate division KSB1 bacterium]